MSDKITKKELSLELNQEIEQLRSDVDNIDVSWDAITNKPTSLPANGGNADTIDGLYADNFVRVDQKSVLRGGKGGPEGGELGFAKPETGTSFVEDPYLDVYANRFRFVTQVAEGVKIIDLDYDYVDGAGMNITWEIQNLKQLVSSGKTQIANAITDKGVPTSPNDSFATMAANISKIPTLPPSCNVTISLPGDLSDLTIKYVDVTNGASTFTLDYRNPKKTFNVALGSQFETAMSMPARGTFLIKPAESYEMLSENLYNIKIIVKGDLNIT